jgi:type IV pilus assembly protein PilY1
LSTASIVVTSPASAQPNDTNPPLPDILLLVDTSGSMENLMDDCNPDTGLMPNGTACPASDAIPTSGAWCDGKTTRPQNRWAAEIAALSGSFGSGYSCVNESRTPGTNTSFVNEYSLDYGGGPVAPYDANYYLNYHRPSEYTGSGTITCVMGFNQTSTGWNPDNSVAHNGPQTDFNLAQIQGYEFDTSTGKLVPPTTPGLAGVPCSFTQNPDGLIPTATQSIRFGLMTLDNDTQPFTGVTAFADGQTFTFYDVVASTPPTAGMWSYFNGWWGSTANATQGRPAGCGELGVSQIPFEVGARNPAAPPWEGRMIRFPSGMNTDPTTTNAQVSKAISVMRPYGANPIAGLMDDAKYYFWTDPQGPSVVDPAASCRPQYIILLSHAAPNLDLQTYCQGTALGNAGMCPYDYPENIAAGLSAGNYQPSMGVVNNQSAQGSGAKVKTFVVGFALSQPTPIPPSTATLHCSDVVNTTSTPPTIDPTKCGTEPMNGADSGTAATDPNAAAYAPCCALARIAAAGGTSAPYFADNSTDLTAALNAILALIVNTETTRATPVVLPQTANNATTGGAASATFISSFDVSTKVPWSGDVQRERYVCNSSGGVWGPQAQAIDPNSGDDFANNLWSSQTGNRYVFAVQPATTTTQVISGAGNVRPYVADNGGKAYDYYSEYDGTEEFFKYSPSSNSPAIDPTLITPQALGLANPVAPAKTTCTIQEPDMTAPFGSTSDNTACETIMLNYMLGTTTPAAWTSGNTTYPFPARFYNSAANPPSSPFGGVYHSTPVIATPPSALLRDDSYQAFITNYTTNYISLGTGENKPRHSVLYVATVDGLLHAFGVDYNSTDTYTFNGNHIDDYGHTGYQNEMWAFIPPATMAKLGAGGGSLSATGKLDGPPVVKDTVYERSQVGASSDWHTSLVAGFGSGQPGYYALDVTDPDVIRHNSNDPGAVHPSGPTGTPPTWPAPAYMGPASPPQTGLVPQGPHFLWQVTFQNPTTDLTATTQSALLPATNDGSANLFAANSVTPAITTVYVADPEDGTKREVGVAILPGGSAVGPGSTTQACPRTGAQGASGIAKVSSATPSGSAYQLSTYARMWGTSCSAPVAGRSVTIVRLDTGEVLRSFVQLNDFGGVSNTKFTLTGGSLWSKNTTTNYYVAGRATEADFDSPMSGTPVPYPSDVGAIAQRIFISDQDGVIWRINVSDTNPANWYVEPFYDAFNPTQNNGLDNAAWAVERSPIVGAPNVTTGRDGNLVLNFGTGDVNSIGITQLPNFVYSVSELPSTSEEKLIASTNWSLQLTPGEMITGPSTVFDGVWYYASYAPGTVTSGCPSGTAYLWGMDFMSAAGTDVNTLNTSGSPGTNGGLAEMTNPLGGSNVQKVASTVGTPAGSAIIPGVAITSTAACASTQTTIDPATGSMAISLSNVAPAQYSVTALVGAPTPGTSSTTSTGGSKVQTTSYAIANGVRTATLVDSWASIVE